MILQVRSKHSGFCSELNLTNCILLISASCLFLIILFEYPLHYVQLSVIIFYYDVVSLKSNEYIALTMAYVFFSKGKQL